MKAQEGQKRAIFPSLIWGGAGGGLGFPFILSKIVGQFWAARVWPHFFHAYEMLFLSTNGPFNFVMPFNFVTPLSLTLTECNFYAR